MEDAGGSDSAPRWTRPDTIASGTLAGIPAILLGLAAAIGYPIMTGDDVAQSYPLDVLTGQILRHGHLPLFDAGLWSGAPLLGGANAHCLLPLSLLFAVLPPVAAWVIGEVAVFAAASIGCQILLRRTGCSCLSAALGGASFGLGGYLSSQAVHIDFMAAAAALPWLAIAVHGIAVGRPDSRPLYSCLLAAGTAWVALTGSPDIVVDAAALGVIFGAHVLVQPMAPGRRLARRSTIVLWALPGAIAGLGIGALQWWPAASFVGVSQRSHEGLSFLGAGSASAANLLTLFVPHLLGGGPIGLARYASGFPLAEIDAYPGVVGLVALAVLGARWRAADAWRWRVWLVTAAAGVVLALGGHTPLERLLVHLPVVGQQRLPARALVLVALGAAMALGHYLDGVLSGRPEWRLRSSLAAAGVPLVVLFGTVLATFVSGKPAGGALHPLPGRGWSLGAVAPALAVSAAVGVGAVSMLVMLARSGRERSPRSLAALTVGLVIVDLVLFDANQSSLAPVRAAMIAGHSAAERSVRRIAANGRYLVIDPSLEGGIALDQVGPPDLSLLAPAPSAEGYGSLTWAPYALATGTHSQASVRVAALSNGVFDILGVRLVLVWPDGPGSPYRRSVLAALSPPHWVRRPAIGGWLAFENTRAAPPVSGLPAQVLSSSPWTGAATVLVSSRRAGTLVRSMAAIPGWQATERPAGAPPADARSVAVRRDGLVQAVEVPAGKTLVTFAYVAPRWHDAQRAALGGAAMLLALASIAVVLRRRRRPGRRRRRPGTGDGVPVLSGPGAVSRPQE